MVGVTLVLGSIIGVQALKYDAPYEHYAHFQDLIDDYLGSATDINLPEGIISWWSFDDSSFSKFLGKTVDIAATNDGTLYGDTVYGPGISNSGLVFDGEGDYVRIPSDGSLNPADQLTVETWMRWDIEPRDGSGWANILYKDLEGKWYPSYQLQHNHDNSKFEFVVSTENSSNAYIWSSTAPQNGSWYHITGTYDGSKLKLYVNGELEKTRPLSGSVQISESDLYLATNGGSRYFSGNIDEVRVYERALPEDEIKRNYQEHSS